MSRPVLALDDEGYATLAQVVLGLLPPTALATADVYTDNEGTPVASRDGAGLTTLQPMRWPHPDDVRTDAPVTVAVADQLPVGPPPPGGTVLLLPTGGVRPDDARGRAWQRAWRSIAARAIEVPVLPRDAQGRADAIAAAYSTGERVEVATTPQPPGPGRVVFFTGLSGSGKSTIARALADRLAGERTVTLLDGDVVRTHLSKGLGFSREDRDTNIRRIGWVAADVAKHGGLAICAPIAPYDETRRWVRHAVEAAAGPGTFVLVHVATPLEVCESRDTKGLYAKARAGEISGFTGIDDPYEVPTDATVTIDTTEADVASTVAQIAALVAAT